MLTMRGCSGSLMDLLRLMLPDRGHIAGPQLQLVQPQGDGGLRVVVVPSNQLKLLLHGRAPNNVEKLHLHELGESCLVVVEQSLPDHCVIDVRGHVVHPVLQQPPVGLGHQGIV